MICPLRLGPWGRTAVLTPILTLLAATWTTASHAEALNRAHVKYYGQAGCCQLLEEGPTPVLLSASQVGHELGWYSVTATAAPGNVIVWGRNHLAGNTGLNTAREMEARSSFDDLVFTDGTGVPKPVSFWLNLELSGSIDIATAGVDQTGCLFGTAIVTASPSNYPGPNQGSWGQIGPGYGCPYPSSGFLLGESGGTLDRSLRLGPYDVQSEQPITIQMRAIITPAPYVPWGGAEMTVTGQLDFRLSQLTAAIESPGFSANSGQAHIVDNRVTNPVDAARVPSAAFRLAQSVPNPARAGASIAFELPRAGAAHLALYDVAGREVRRLADGWLGAGAHVAHWDGRDAAGRGVAPGIYLYRLHAGGVARTRTLVVTR